jgi:DsbC/DsbD-like thiol-disulfide interchange protein
MQDAWTACMVCTFLSLVCIADQANAQSTQPATTPKVTADLIPDRSSIAPGSSFEMAIRFRIEKGWHMYWLNPGDSGLAPTVEWELPQGVWLSTELKFPPPHRIRAGEGLESFGYEDELVVFAEGRVDGSVQGSVEVSARLSWLVCQDVCLAEQSTVRVSLEVGKSGSKDPRVDGWLQQLARPGAGDPIKEFGVRLNEGQSSGVIYAYIPAGWQKVDSEYDFFPPAIEFASFDRPEVKTDSRGKVVEVPFRILPGMTEPITGQAMLVRIELDGKRSGFLLPLTFDFR